MTILPQSARTKLEAIRRGAADAAALHGAAVAAGRALQERIGTISQELGTRTGLDPARHSAMSAEIATLNAEIEANEAKIAVRARRSAVDAQIVRQLDRWIAALAPGTALSALPPPASQDVPNVAAAIETLRERVAALKLEARQVRAAPRTTEETSREVRAIVEALAEKGKPRIGGVADAVKVAWPVDAVALAAWVAPEALIDRLEAEVAAGVGDRKAISAADKARRLAELDAELLQAERREEVLIETALERGLDVQRRRDVSPEAILGIAVGVAKAKAA